ncbi:MULTISPECIES: FAD-dependent monooxygenase [unclassified Mycobacterium]|uniref:FAD-dependent monooxygenase n=1 Tax=unclassified Mycobacterium TaxID=2642494 RepID=UPI0029C9758D|nr:MULTISPECIES: FAD-dependent monooxygenase [unclassified Mycobacterium]
MSAASARLSVGVIGGGIGGAAAAQFLRRAGVDVTVFEQADEFREVGAGVQVSPNAVRLLERVGIAERLAEFAATPDVIWQFHKWRTGEIIFEQELSDANRAAWGAPYFLVHRAKLLAALCQGLPAGTIRLRARCTDLERLPDGRVRLVLDGQPDRPVFDAVIIADGIQSPLRAKVFGFAPPLFSGYYAFRAVADRAATPLPARPAAMAIWLGPDRHFVHYPIERGEVVNLVCAVPTPTWDHPSNWADGTVEEFREAFAGWHPTVDALISAATTTRKFALYYSDPLPTWTDGPIALLGDAAHPMLSFFAQGSGQAIEDAAVLARSLQGVSRDGVAEALSTYAAIRRPRSGAIQQNANARLHSYHFEDGPEQVARDERLASSDPLTANSWVYEHDVEQEFEERRPVSVNGSDAG